MAKADWLADVLRAAELKVVEVDGWKTRGRPGGFGPVKGVICHHTGPGSSTGLLALVTIGRDAPPLPGPLSQLFLDVDGTFHVVAAGRCNHAGAGSWHGVTDGNGSFVGIEARNPGDGSDWPVAQVDAYTRGVAAILEHIGADAVMCAGHKEFATPRGRKVDPTLDMFEFREAVEGIMAGTAGILLPSDRDPVRDMLKKGDRGDGVRLLQHYLGITADGDFGPATDKAVKIFQAQHALVADGKVGPKTWAALGVK